MRRFPRYLLLGALVLPAFGQKLNDQRLNGDIDKMLTDLNKQMSTLGMQFQSMDQFLAQVDPHIGPNFFNGPDFGYDAGMRDLDSRRYDAAIRNFNKVIAAKSSRSEGALYWKAYALNRLGRQDEALAAIAALERDYPKSRWLTDAQALKVEARQSAGKPVSPDAESNDDLKLIAINGLMNANPERAVPQLETLLKGNAGPQIKDRAMFVLSQNSSPQAQQILANYAKGAGNPDLQAKAVRYLGIAGGQEKIQLLVDVYNGTTDGNVKRAAVQALFIANAGGKLVELARKERDPDLKKAIVHQLSAMSYSKEAIDYMIELLK